MKVIINYKLYTDGDYTLRNPEKFGCIDKCITLNDFEYYDYVGLKEFQNDEKWRCKNNAKDFLWKFLCEGLTISYTHYWLLKDFYNIIEYLTSVIDQFENGVNEITQCISGNYLGTEIKIKMIE